MAAHSLYYITQNRFGNVNEMQCFYADLLNIYFTYSLQYKTVSKKG